MRSTLATLWLLSVTGVALAQPADNATVPRVIGNRANGFSYQPTQNEVDEREASAGLLPSTTQQHAIDRELTDLDRRSLQSAGLSTSSVPDFNRHP